MYILEQREIKIGGVATSPDKQFIPRDCMKGLLEFLVIGLGFVLGFLLGFLLGYALFCFCESMKSQNDIDLIEVTG